MKNKLKKLFILGAGIAAAGVTVAYRKKIKETVQSFVKKGAITAQEGKVLAKELLEEAKKSEKKMKEIIKKHISKAKKPAKKKAPQKKKKTAKKKK